MKVSNVKNHTLNLMHESVFTVGQAGTGKTSLLQELMAEYIKEDCRIGILCTAEDATSYTTFLNSMKNHLKVSNPIQFYLMSEPLSVEDAKRIAEEVEVLFIDEGDFIIGEGENLNQFLDWWEGITKVISYLSLDSIAKSAVFIEGTLTRFDKMVFFKNNKTFVTNVMFGQTLATDIEALNHGEAFVLKSFYEIAKHPVYAKG